MKHLFTSEKKRPSAKTYRAFDKDESQQAYYVN